MTIDAYDPFVAPDPAAWLALTEDVRLELVQAWHAAAEPDAPNVRQHALIQTVVENQAALGDAQPVQRKLAQLVAQGLDRHEALHAVGAVLAGHLHFLMTHDGYSGDGDARYASLLRRLNARDWRRGRW